MTTITLLNPATGELIDCAFDGLTADDLASFPLDEAVCAEIARDVAPCLPEEFLVAYVQRVGIVKAGMHILGSWLEHKASELGQALWPTG
jgi:hypothetical protein